MQTKIQEDWTSLDFAAKRQIYVFCQRESTEQNPRALKAQ